jgi:parallel beta-helix repeat protein
MNTICNNEITQAFMWYTIWLIQSHHNAIEKNLITNNSGVGIALMSSRDNTVNGNNVTGIPTLTTRNGEGILLYGAGSYNNVVSSNRLVYNQYSGVSIMESGGNIIQDNILEYNFLGIYSWKSSNTICGNTVSNNEWYGISFFQSNMNIIYHNNFLDNGIRVSPGYDNTWDDGYPSGGNYWSDYTGVDVKSGPNQDDPSSDGIGDTAYFIDAGDVDHYPLMYPWGTPPPPSYTLTVHSSPSGVTFTVDGVPRTTPWSGTYSEGSSVSLVMPETHDEYEWLCWLEDRDPNRVKTVTMDKDIALTGVFTPPRAVGGKAVPIGTPTVKSESHTSWIWLTTVILPLAVTPVLIKHKKKKQ